MSEKFVQLLQIMDRLRGDQGCPWDREQTRESIKPFLLEETYEVLEAIDQSKPAQLKEELGDLLLQIVFHCQIAKERGEFDAETLISACIDKLVRRHPHVFGDHKVKDSEEVLHRWEDLKRQERGSEGEESSLLDGLPKALPALLQAHRVQERVSRSGFDWPKTPSPHQGELGEGLKGVVAKVQEELRELEEAIRHRDRKCIEEELGDLLFSLVNLARLVGVEPEGALRQTTFRFIERFKKMNRLAKSQGKSFRQLSLEEKDRLWEQVKAEEG